MSESAWIKKQRAAFAALFLGVVAEREQDRHGVYVELRFTTPNFDGAYVFVDEGSRVMAHTGKDRAAILTIERLWLFARPCSGSEEVAQPVQDLQKEYCAVRCGVVASGTNFIRFAVPEYTRSICFFTPLILEGKKRRTAYVLKKEFPLE